MSETEAFLESNTCGSHAYLYKCKERNSALSQQERREEFLRKQKEKRHEATDKHREQFVLFCEQHDEEEEQEEEQYDEPMDYECTEIKYKARRPKFSLTMSEWFTEIPEDLRQNWVVKFAPEGFRVMVIARGKKTTLYNERRVPICRIKSNLPGGGGKNKFGSLTILDCIWNKRTNTVFVLDCLYWNGISLIDSEASCRFFWINSGFAEDPDLLKRYKFRFRNLEDIPADQSLIQDQMFDVLNVENDSYFYDGVVFYHKEGRYTFGITPLVGWLASYMLPEMLHIDVAPEHMVRKPKDYQNVHDHVLKISKLKEERDRKRGRNVKDEEMDST